MEQQTDTQTESTQAEESHVNSAAGTEAESVATDSTTGADSLTLSEINELTGMNYKDKDSALKSIKDMKSQAGKAADLEGKLKALSDGNNGSQNDEALNELKEQLNQVKLENFYSKNPDVNRELAETIAKAQGIDVQEAINTDLYKSTVAAPEKRTIADSNNRVAQSSKDEFNPKDHAGNADALAGYVVDKFLNK